jgi:hypothetical protein
MEPIRQGVDFESPATTWLPVSAGCMPGTPLPLGMWQAAHTCM